MNLTQKVRGFFTLLKYRNRFGLVLQRTLLSSTGLAVYRVDGQVLLVDHIAGDHNGLEDCFLSNQYRHFLQQMDLAGKIRVLDLGANVGSFSLLLHGMGHEFSRLTCVEMNPQTFSRLQFNLLRNVKTQPQCLCGAVSAGSGTLEIKNIPGGTGQKSTDQSDDPEENWTIPKLTLDEILGSDEVDLCKLDIEGSEYELFAQQALEALKRCRNLIIEIHTPPADQPGLPEELKQYIQELGFEPLPGNASNPDLFGYRRKAQGSR